VRAGSGTLEILLSITDLRARRRTLDSVSSAGGEHDDDKTVTTSIRYFSPSAVDLKFLQFVCTHVKELQIQKPH
jgi:hypothetical protein